jgi:hypothetical protein
MVQHMFNSINMEKSYTNQKTDSQRPYAHPHPLISRNNKTNLKVKLLIYKTLLKSIWAYGIQLWDSAKTSNTNKI